MKDISAMDKILIEQLSRMKFLGKFNPSVSLNEQKSNTIQIPNFGTVKVSDIPTYKEGMTITVNVTDGRVEFITTPNFKGLYDLSSGDFGTFFTYDKKEERILGSPAKYSVGIEDIAKIPFLVRIGDEIVVQGLTIEYTPMKENRRVEEGVKQIVIGERTPSKEVNPIPGGVLNVTHIDVNSYPIFTPPTPIDEPSTITKIDLKVDDPFEYDSIELNDKTKNNYLLPNIAQIIKFKKLILDQGIKIYIDTYSSIDGDSNKKVTGSVQACRGFGDGTRRDYNLCLSQQRAKRIADFIIMNVPELKDRVIYTGHGETDKFNGVKWTKEKPTTPEETKPNRKLEFKLDKPIKLKV